MKINFLILVHHRPNQVAKLVDVLLNYPHSKVYIHVDLKAADTFTELKLRYKQNQRVELIDERYKVYWGSFNQVCATLSLIKASAKNPADYFCLISGQDFPTQPIHAFADFLKAGNGSDYLVNFKLPDEQWGEEGGLGRLNKYWLNVKSRNGSFFRNKAGALIYLIHKVTGFRRKLRYNYFGGSNWFNLSAKSINYILQFLEKNPSYLNEFKYSRSADEIFIQSIVMNAPGTIKVVSEDLRLVDWVSGPEFPRTFRKEDFNKIVNSEDKFFARKFDEETDAEIINLLHEHCNK